MNNQKTIPYAKKRFGQNFLVDQSVLQRIMTSLAIKPQDFVFEIGPGRGALTKLLIADCDHLYAIELDRDLIEVLNNKFDRKSLTLFSGDVLKFNFEELEIKTENKIRVIGNLPYNISTELLFRLIPSKHLIKDLHFMLQKEVVDRLAANPGNKKYGRLTVLMQYYFDIAPLFNIDPNSFSPKPKVDSSFVRLSPKIKHEVELKNYQNFKNLVSTAFQFRRKTLRNALKSLFTEKELVHFGCDPKLRPENLSVSDYVNLSNKIK